MLNFLCRRTLLHSKSKFLKMFNTSGKRVLARSKAFTPQVSR